MDAYDDTGADHPDDGVDPGRGALPAGPPGPGGGIAALSTRYRVVAAVGLAAVAVLACVHLAMVFLYVAPSNTLSKQHGQAIDRWVNPEFEQNWKLFAPNPLQQNIDVQARATTQAADGRLTTSPWIDLSAQDGAAILHNPLPSHTQQNEVRRAWDYFTTTHNERNQPVGTGGELSEQYLIRIVMLRLGHMHVKDPVQQVQLRSATAAVPSPPWSDERVDTRTFYRVCPWWTVTPADVPAGGAKSVEQAADTRAAGTEGAE
jgi:Family of unknown function (DUF5819)